MASSPFKQLKEHLHDQQQPFALEVYIAERRILLNKKPKESVYSWKLDKKKVVRARDFLKFIFYKFRRISSSCEGPEDASILSSRKSRSWKTKAAKGHVKVHNLDTFLASAKFNNQQESAVAKTCEARKRERLEEKGNADVKRKSEGKEGDEQRNPVSVLDGTEIPLSRQGASASDPCVSKNSGGESIVSILLWELLTKTLIENHSNQGFGELQDVIGPGFCRNRKTERELLLQQHKQFLLDCVKEAIEVHKRKHKKNEFISLNELTKFIADQVFLWRKRTTDASWIVEEWSYTHRLNREIAVEIGDSIMDHIILEVVELLVQ